MPTSPLLDLAAQQFVLLTTFRRTGEAVSTPVWVAPDGDRLLVTTGPSSGKVKRLAHTSRVQLEVCSMRGEVQEESVPLAAVAEVRTDAETLAALDGALVRKYGLQYRALRASQKLRGKAAQSVALVITPSL